MIHVFGDWVDARLAAGWAEGNGGQASWPPLVLQPRIRRARIRPVYRPYIAVEEPLSTVSFLLFL